MSNKELLAKIKAEIERISSRAMNEEGQDLCEYLLSFIVARHFAQWGAEHAKIDVTDFCKPIDLGIAQCIADHSWEMLGEDEKLVPNGLEEAATITLDEAESVADEYTGFLEKGLIENQPRPIGGKWFIEYARKRFIVGAEWQKEQDEKEQADLFTIVALDAAQRAKEQMMKEAVEYEVGMHGEPIKITFDKYVQRARGIFPGDKVRIIIVKED